jgi:soluble lytic murein transglycosylase-like protein
MRVVNAIAGLCCALACHAASADIYGYIDADGSAHFSTEQVDARYQLFMHGNESFDSSQLASPAPSGRTSALFNYLARHPNLQKYETMLTQAAQEFSLEPALLKAVMAAESGFNPDAVSPKGAIGLMQIMPATAERYGLQADRKKTLEQKLADPKTNIRLGARYLRDLHRLFPLQPELVIASYNAGERAVQKYSNTIPPYPETRSYVQIVKQFYSLYKPEARAISVLALSESSGSSGSSGPSSNGRRIHMTIPGRHNMPPTTLE